MDDVQAHLLVPLVMPWLVSLATIASTSSRVLMQIRHGSELDGGVFPAVIEHILVEIETMLSQGQDDFHAVDSKSWAPAS